MGFIYLIFNTISEKNNKDKNKKIKTLINSISKVNAMHLVYITKLGLCNKKIYVST